MSTLDNDDVQKIIDIALMYIGRKATHNVKTCPWVALHDRDNELNLQTVANLALHHKTIDQHVPSGLVENYYKMLVAALLFASQQSQNVTIQGVLLNWPSLMMQIPSWQTHRAQVLAEVKKGNTSYGIKP